MFSNIFLSLVSEILRNEDGTKTSQVFVPSSETTCWPACFCLLNMLKLQQMWGCFTGVKKKKEVKMSRTLAKNSADVFHLGSLFYFWSTALIIFVRHKRSRPANYPCYLVVTLLRRAVTFHLHASQAGSACQLISVPVISCTVIPRSFLAKLLKFALYTCTAGTKINPPALQEVGIMRLFHWLEFNWEAAMGPGR